MSSRRRAILFSLVLVLSATACGGDTVSTTDLGTASSSDPAAVSDDCLVDEDVAVSGLPRFDNDLRHEDIIELLTGERS